MGMRGVCEEFEVCYGIGFGCEGETVVVVVVSVNVCYVISRL